MDRSDARRDLASKFDVVGDNQQGPRLSNQVTQAEYDNIARTYSENYHFMLVEIDGDVLHFQAISRTGATIDAGRLRREPASDTRTLTRADTEPDQGLRTKD